MPPVWLPDSTYTTRLGIVLAYSALSAAWTYSLVSRLRPGLPRFVATLPLVLGNCLIPLVTRPETEVCTSTAVIFLFIWLASFKEVGFAINRGPLCTGQKYNLFQFWALLTLPISPRFDLQDSVHKVRSFGKLTEHGGTSGQLLLRFVAKLTALGAVVFLLENKEKLPVVATELLYAWGLYTFLGFLSEGPASLIVSVIRIPISPHFDEPYRATSLGDFWGRRWNITASNTLRFLIYDPIQEGRLVHDRSVAPVLTTTRRLIGMLASFVASGVIHEIIFWYIMGVATWKWLIYFSIQGPLVLVEIMLKRAAKRRNSRLPAWASIPLTWVVLIWVAHHFFFPPTTETGLADRVVGSIHQHFQSMFALVAASGVTAGMAS